MNKFIAYTVVAILLGSVMMVFPLAMLGPDNLVPDDKQYNILGAGEENSQRSDCPPSSEGTTQQSNGTDTYHNSSQNFVHETEVSLNTASGLSSMGLMVVPGFLVALGVFIYLKKRTM